MAMEYSSWWPAPSWISPGAALFLLCNVLVGAIVVTSSRGNKAGGRAAASTRRLCRSASSMVLDRLRSFSMFSVHPVPVEEDGYALYMELEAEVQQPHPAAAEPAMIPTATASAAVAAASATSSESAKEKKDERVSSDEVQGPAEGHAQQPPSSSSPVAAAATEATAAAERPATVVGSIVQRARACRREFVEEALEGKAALNARAELFIQQFREDLKLQRLNSIINYTRALRRGAGGAAPGAGE